MRKSLVTEAQIIGILKQAEAGRLVTDLCREHGITQATFYRWRSKYGGMEVSDAQECLASPQSRLCPPPKIRGRAHPQSLVARIP